MSIHPQHRAIAAAISAGVPVHIEGNPGEAKTATLEDWGTRWGRHVEVITGSSRDKGDFMGMPVEVDGEVVYSPPQWVRKLQAADKGLLVLDELQSSSESFEISMRIVQERVVGEAPLHEGVSIVAISNPVDVAVNGQELPAPLANRFMHADWHFDFNAWAEGLLTDFRDTEVPDLRAILSDPEDRDDLAAEIRGSVLAFLRDRVDLQAKVPTDLVKASKGWPSPRSWTNAIRAMSHLPKSDHAARDLILIGCVGQGAATEYIQWVETQDLHNPREVMDDPSIVDWSNERPDRLFALVTAVRGIAMSSGDVKDWKKGMAVLVACAEGGKPDVAAPGARQMLRDMPSAAKMPRGTREAFGPMMERIGMRDRAKV